MKYLILTFIFISSFSFGQIVRHISPDDIDGLQVTRIDSFAGKSIYNYLGSRTDLCREYGILQLDVLEYSFQDDNVRLEIYIMQDASSAYGMYSLSITNCEQSNLFSTFSCKNINRVSAAYGSFYINAVNLGKTRSGQDLCVNIVRMVIEKNRMDVWYIPPIFQAPSLSPYVNSLKYLKGPIGLALGAPFLADFLRNDQFDCFSVTINSPPNSGILARIVFGEIGALGQFLVNTGVGSSYTTNPTMIGNGVYRSCFVIDDYKLIYLESNTPDLRITDLIPERPNSTY
jgi:hypothetical protein